MKYDLAGNIIEKVSNGDTITTSYDLMSRLKTRRLSAKSYAFDDTSALVPGWAFPFYDSLGLTIDSVTHTFDYDVMGNLTAADNDLARISRSYYPNGLLRTDTLAMKDYVGSSFSTHVYGLGFVYDRDGRRVAVQHPWPQTTPTHYSFAATTGRLTTVTAPSGHSWGFGYDGNGQVHEMTLPAGVDSMTYDAEGRLRTHRIKTGGVYRLSESLDYTIDGRVRSSSPNNSVKYDGLRHLSEAVNYAAGGGSIPVVTETFQRDPFGNVLVSRMKIPCETCDPYHVQDSIGRYVGFYGPGRVQTDLEERWGKGLSSDGPQGWYGNSSSNEYLNGNQVRRTTWNTTWIFGGLNDVEWADEVVTYRSESRSYYAADRKLRVQQILRDSLRYPSGFPTAEGDWGAYEEYWYDALGRRILKRSRQDDPICVVNDFGRDRCESAIERYVWDGDQILWELRDASGALDNPGAATIGYVHAGGIDAPIGMLGGGAGGTIALHRNWRGLYAFATNTLGNQTTCSPNYYPGCTKVLWPAEEWDAELDGVFTQLISPVWYGSLPMGHEDRTGLIYRRNRYYDPASGQFTQQDPIGIAGGLNLYGYANGDPINFSDPFGLCRTEAGPGDTIQITVTVDCGDGTEGTREVDAVRLGEGQLAAVRSAVGQLTGGTSDVTPAEVAAWYALVGQNIYSHPTHSADGYAVTTGGQTGGPISGGPGTRVSFRADVLQNLHHPLAAQVLGHEGAHLVNWGNRLGLTHDQITAILWNYR